jgi:hypothetical protein
MWSEKIFVETLDLTSYLPKFLPDLKNCDGASVSFNRGAKEVVRLRIESSGSGFGWSYRWQQGGLRYCQSTEKDVLKR